MKRTDTSEWPCTIARGAHVLADLWNILLLRQAFYGTRRFEDFQRALGVGRNTLTARLGGLVDHGLLCRVTYQDRPLRHEYRLTDRGRDAFGVVAAMAAWGEHWTSGPEGTPVILHHTACGHDMHAVVVCGACAAPLDPSHVRGRPGPGAPARPG